MPVGRYQALIDAPGGLDLDVVLDPEQRGEPGDLAVGEQVGAGVQGPPGAIQRVLRAAAVSVQLLLDPATALVQRIGGQADDVERVHHRDRRWQLLGRGGLEPGEPVHRDHLNGITPRPRPAREPGRERLLGAARSHVEEASRAAAVADRRQIDDDGHVLVALPGVPPHVLIDADDLDALEAVRVRDQGPSALGEDRVVGGVPRHTEAGRDPRHRQVPHDQPFESPPQATPEIFARAGAAREVS